MSFIWSGAGIWVASMPQLPLLYIKFENSLTNLSMNSGCRDFKTTGKQSHVKSQGFPSVQFHANCAVLILKCAVPTAHLCSCNWRQSSIHFNEIDHLITTLTATNYSLVFVSREYSLLLNDWMFIGHLNSRRVIMTSCNSFLQKKIFQMTACCTNVRRKMQQNARFCNWYFKHFPWALLPDPHAVERLQRLSPDTSTSALWGFAPPALRSETRAPQSYVYVQF